MRIYLYIYLLNRDCRACLVRRVGSIPILIWTLTSFKVYSYLMSSKFSKVHFLYATSIPHSWSLDDLVINISNEANRHSNSIASHRIESNHWLPLRAGSAFKLKNKSEQSGLLLIRKGLLRALFMPYYLRWWVK